MRKLVIYFMLLFCMKTAYAQSATKKFGQTMFDIFKNDSIAVLPKYRLPENDLITFLTSHKIDTAREQIKKYISNYADITTAFFQKCAAIENDSTKYPTWKNAELLEIHLKRNGSAEPDADENDGSNHFYLMAFIKSGTKKYRFELEIMKYQDKWLLGNYVECYLTDFDLLNE